MTQSGANPSLAILAVLAGKRGVVSIIIERCSKYLLPAGAITNRSARASQNLSLAICCGPQLTEAIEDGNGKADHMLVVVFKGANRVPRKHLINVVMMPLRQSN